MGATLAPLIIGYGASQAALTATAIGINAALYVGASALQYVIAQQEATASDPSQRLVVALGGTEPQKIIFGETEVAGHLAYAGVFGRSGARSRNYAARQFVFSDYPVDSIRPTTWYEGRKATADLGSSGSFGGLNIGAPITTFRRGGIDYKWQKFYDGRQTSADAYLRNRFGSAAKRPYGADRIGHGRAYVILTERLDRKSDRQTLGQARYTVRGMRCYDPRKDSTNGGSGSHRWNNPATHEFTRNPAVIYYSIRRGIYYEGKRLYGGLNYSAYMLDNDTYFAAMNVCDENVTLAAGGTEKRFECGGEIDLTERVGNVLDRLLACMSGRVVEDGGVSRLYAGGIGASVLSFTDDDIIATEQEDGEDGPDPDAVFNTVTGTYTEPDDGGQLAAFRKKADADALARDGEELTRALDLPYVRNNRQAQRLARKAAREGQRWLVRGIVLPPWARGLRPCKVVSWTSAARGWSAKKFICGDVTPMKNGNVHVKLREADPADDDHSTADEEAYDTGAFDDETIAAEPFTAAIAAVAITDNGGNDRRAAIQFLPSATVLDGGTWAAVKPDFEDAVALHWQVRKASDDEVIARGRSDDFFEDGIDKIHRNAFLPGLAVEVNYRVEFRGGKFSDWQASWTAITLSTTRLKVQDLDSGDANDIDAINTPNIRRGAVLGSESITVRRKKWTKNGTDNFNKDLLPGNALVPNKSGSPLLVSWKMKVSAVCVRGPSGVGYATASILPTLTHVNSGEKVRLGKLQIKTTDKKSINSRTFTGSYLFSQVKVDEAAEFKLVAACSVKLTGGFYSGASFTVDGGEIEIRRWKV
jgi:hypothetical protein